MSQSLLECVNAVSPPADDQSCPSLTRLFLGTDDPLLVVDCPHCGRAVPYPGRAGDGSPLLAECTDPRCDVYFDFDPSRVHAAACS